MGPLVCQEISDQALQSIVEKLQETYRTTLDQNYLDIIGGEIKSAALSIFQRLQNAETAETPKPKRQRFGTSTASQPELGSAANLAQPMSQDVFLHPRPYPMATSLSTPGPCNGSFVDSAYPPSSADSINIDPKLLEKEAHTNEGRREPDPQDLNSVGTHFDGWKYPKVNHMAQSKDKGPPKDNSINPSQTILEGLGPVQEFCRNNPRSSDC